MNLHTIKNIQRLQSNPSVTLTLPTHRTYPDNEKDAIRLKNLVNEAISRLEKDFGKRESAPIAEKINRLAAGVSHRHNLDGLVIFASADYAELFHLPFCLPERVTVADNFLTRDLVYALNRSPLYLLTVLSEHGTRLFVGHKDALDEVNAYGFPFSLAEETAEANPSQDISHVRDQMITDHMREVGDALLEGLFYELLGVVYPADGDDGVCAEVGSHYEGLVLEVADDAYARSSSCEARKRRLEFSAEVRIFKIVNRACKRVFVCVVRGHTASAGA